MTKMVIDTKSDRMVADSTQRRLRRQLSKYLSETDVDKVLAGEVIEPQINNPKDARALVALMPAVQAFLRGQA